MSSSIGCIATQHRLLLGNPQGSFYTAFTKKLPAPNMASMGATFDMDAFRVNLRKAMERKGIKPTTLSLAVGDNKALVKSIFDRNGDIKIGTLSKLASVLDVSIEVLLSADPVAITGFIGAGGTIIFNEFDTGETAPRPPAVSGMLEALVVRGDSMLPKYRDGDIIYIQKGHDGILPDYLGEDCAVRLSTGETFIKQIIAGSEENRFTLLSLNAPPIENVEITWATPVAFIMPGRSRHLFY